MSKSFTCSGNETIHIRLDPTRGYQLENVHDILTVEYEGYRKQFTGGIENLDPQLKQSDWYNLNTTWLKLKFTTDSTIVYKGFIFEVTCPNMRSFHIQCTIKLGVSSKSCLRRGRK